jgi:hypothetical protein
MRRWLLVIAILLLGASESRAQYTTVSATVLDPTGNPYVNGSFTAQFSDPGTSGKLPLLNGSTFQTVVSGQLDSFGSFTAVVADNMVIASSSDATNTTWVFNICSQTYSTLNNQKFCFNWTAPAPPGITGGAINISTQLQAVAATLPVSSGGGISVNAMPLTSANFQNNPPITWSVSGANVIPLFTNPFQVNSGGSIASPNITNSATITWSVVAGVVTANAISTTFNGGVVANPTTFNSTVSHLGPSIFGGATPWIDTAIYGMRAVPSAFTATANCVNGSTSVALPGGAFSSFQTGDGIVLYSCGPANTLATPAAPTVTPSQLSGPDTQNDTVAGPTGSTTYSYCIVARDKNGGLTKCGPSGTTTSGVSSAVLGAPAVAVSTLTRSGNTVTVVTSSASNAAVGGVAFITQSNDATFSGYYKVASVTPPNTFTYTQGMSTLYGATTSATGGTVTFYNANHLSWPPVANAWQYYIYTAGGSLLGVTRPGESYWNDFGSMSYGVSLPDFVPTNAPGSATNDYLATTIVSGGGTNNVVVANAAGSSISGTEAKFDDGPNLNNAFGASCCNLKGGLRISTPPAGNFYFINSHQYLTPGGSAVITGGGCLIVNETIEMNAVRWTGEEGGGCTNNSTQFSWTPSQQVTIGTAFPGFTFLNPSTVDNFTFSAPAQGLIMTFADGWGFNSQIEHDNFLVNGTDFMGQAVVEYGTSNMVARYDLFDTNDTSGYGYSLTPLVLLKDDQVGANPSGSFSCQHCYFVGRTWGVDNTPTGGGGAVYRMFDTYAQANRTPMMMVGANGLAQYSLDNVIGDTSSQAYFANMSGAGMSVILVNLSNTSVEFGGRPGMVTGLPIQQLNVQSTSYLNGAAIGQNYQLTNMTGPTLCVNCAAAGAYNLSVNGPSSFQGYQDVLVTSAPVNPPTGYIRLFGNLGSGQYSCLTSTGANCAPSGSSTAFQANGSPLSSSTTLNFLNSVAFNGVTFTFANPSGGQVQLGATGQFTNAALLNSSLTINGQNVALGATGNIPFQVNGVNNSSLSGLNFLNSTANSVGLAVTFSNPGTSQVKAEITGGTYTGTAAALGATPSTCTLPQFATGIAANGNAICNTPAGSGNVTNGGTNFTQYEPVAASNGTTQLTSIPAWLDAGLQTGATADVQLNNCNTNTIAALIGACNAQDLPNSATLAAQVNVGNSTPYATTLTLPGNSTWLTNGGFTGGTSCAIFQNGSTQITGSEAPLKMKIQSGSGSGGLKSLYCNNGGGYYRLDHVTFYNPTTPTASNIGVNISGGFDGSRWSDWAVIDYQDAVALQVSHICCSAALENMVVNSNYTGHTPESWVSDNTGTINGAGTFNMSVGHPAATFNAFSLSDTSTAHNSSTWHFGTYVEGSNADSSTPIVNLAGSGAATFVGNVFKAETANSTAPAFQVTNAFGTCLNVLGLSMVGGGGSWTYPATAVANLFTGNSFLTDSHGNFGLYSSCPSAFEALTVYSLTAPTLGTGNVCVTAGVFYTSGCSGGGGPGTGTQFALTTWSTTGTLGSSLGTITGQVPVAQNGGPPVFQSPGIAGSTISSASPYPVQCDSSTTTLDRLRSLIFTAAAGVTVTIPDAGSTGCGGNFTFTLGAGPGAGTVTVNRTSSSTFTVLDGSTATSGLTTFSLTAGQTATVSSPDNSNYLVRKNAGGGSGGGFGGFSSGNLAPIFTTSVANPTTSPAQSFALTAAAADSILGNPTGSSAGPIYTANPVVAGISTQGNPTFNALAYGCVADNGTTDNTACYNTMNTAAAFAGGTIFFPYAGTASNTYGFNTAPAIISGTNIKIECAPGVILKMTAASTVLFSLSGANNFTIRNCALAPPASGSAGHLIEDNVLVPVNYILIDNVILNPNSSTATTGSGWVDIRGGSHHFINANCVTSSEVCVQIDNQSGSTHNVIDDVKIRGNYVEVGAGKQAINVLPNSNGTVKRIDTDITCSTTDVCVAYVGNGAVANGSVKGVGVWTATGTGIMWHLACFNCVIGPIDANDGGFTHSTANLLSVTDGWNNVINNISLTTTSNHGQPFQLIDTHDTVVNGLVVGGTRATTTSTTTNGWDPAQPAVKVAVDASNTVGGHNSLTNIVINAPPSYTGDAIQISCPQASDVCDSNTIGSGVKITAVSATGNAINVLAAGTSATALNQTICPSSIQGFATGVSVTSPGTANICQIKMVSVTTPWSCGTSAGCLINDLSTQVTFANIPSNLANGSTLFISDGTIGTTCAGSGSGAFLRQINAVHHCE